jgi:putative acetyltransferase
MTHIRPIEARDNPAIAAIIRTVMPEMGAGGAGFAIHDPEVDTMFEAYSGPRASYFVVEHAGRIVAGGGVAQLAQGPHEVCELKKMYMLREARGQGIGARLLATCLEAAKAHGFAQCYLETLDTMRAARKLYEKNGFQPLTGPMGNTGHFGCDRWYLRPL